MTRVIQLKYKPATNELVVLNESGFDNGPIENQVLPVTKLKRETSTSVGPQQMTDCCTSGTNLAVLLLKVGALGFATSTVLFHLHPMKKKHFQSLKDLTKTRVYLQKIKVMSMGIGRRDLWKFTPLRQVDGAIVPGRQTWGLRHLEHSFYHPQNLPSSSFIWIHVSNKPSQLLLICSTPK